MEKSFQVHTKQNDVEDSEQLCGGLAVSQSASAVQCNRERIVDVGGLEVPTGAELAAANSAGTSCSRS